MPMLDAWQTTVTAATEPNAQLTTGSISKAAMPSRNVNSHALTGVASYYWQDQMTATGERFDRRALTAAHKTLPFGTRVRVKRADNGNSVIVRINDRGPFKPGRVIDLSERAAETLGMTAAGISKVSLEVLSR